MKFPSEMVPFLEDTLICSGVQRGPLRFLNGVITLVCTVIVPVTYLMDFIFGHLLGASGRTSVHRGQMLQRQEVLDTLVDKRPDIMERKLSKEILGRQQHPGCSDCSVFFFLKKRFN